MEPVLYLLALLQPVFFINVNLKLFGLEVFDAAAIGFSSILMLAFATRAALLKSIRLSPLDMLLVAFVVWCIAVYVIYIEKSFLKEVAKLTLPLLTYVMAKNILSDRAAYRRMLQFMIVGFTLPVLLSGTLTAMGQGVEHVSYWTKIPRYEGIYRGTHNMGHNMGLVVMLMVVYRTIIPEPASGMPRVSRVWMSFCVGLGGVALYCLFHARVRTTMLGLLAFMVVYLYYVNRKLLFVGAAVLAISVPILMPSVVANMFYDVAKVVSGEWEFGKLGSNRLNIWWRNIVRYGELPIDRQIGGVGIGNKTDLFKKLDSLGELSDDFEPDNFRNSHNDYLEMMIQTGLVGFLLFITVQILLYQRVRRLIGHDRYVFLALFWAVFVMNILSNSYVTRFGLAMMFYLVMTYVEIPERQANVQQDLVTREDNDAKLLSPRHRPTSGDRAV